MSSRSADEEDAVTLVLEPNRRAFRPVVEEADAADGGGGQDRGTAPRRLALIVEAYVPAHDREIQRAAGFGHAFEAADELGHDLGALRVAEVEAVGNGKRPGADRAKVAIGF